eukprot:Pgem_evm1s17016
MKRLESVHEKRWEFAFSLFSIYCNVREKNSSNSSSLFRIVVATGNGSGGDSWLNSFFLIR